LGRTGHDVSWHCHKSVVNSADSISANVGDCSYDDLGSAVGLRVVPTVFAGYLSRIDGGVLCLNRCVGCLNLLRAKSQQENIGIS